MVTPDPSALVVGWIAAFIGAIGFGSFAVPIKGEAANSVDIDPLVMQSYKSLMCFLTSWLVLLLGQEFSFTWWGIVSGMFWVPAGAFNIFAIRNAGLAVSQGIVSSSIVMVSFIWGNLVFREEVQSQPVAYFAILQIMAGLWGMSYFSSVESSSPQHSDSDVDGDEKADLMLNDEEVDEDFGNEPSPLSEPLEISDERKSSTKGRAILICGKTYQRRYVGLCSALICGIWGGSCLVPMHYAKGENTSGLGYVISFSVGALVVTIFAWVCRFSYHLVKLRSLWEAYEILPPFHLKVMWLPGAIAGSVWSLGNVGSIVAVKHLGQGVGYSASQAALLVSGMWGMFYYKEVTNPVTVVKWFLSAFVTIGGILLLGYESHVEN
ncbi:hypothetical protein ACHAXS_013729 [Conticribra weissflogii]